MTAKQKKFKVGLAGLSRGKSLVKVFSAHPRVEVSALCDIDQNRLKEMGAVFNLTDKQLFTKFDDFINSDIDIVIIATPIPLHTEQCIKSLENGKHVLCEQTMAYTVKECEQTINAVKKSNKIYMMAENYCYFHYIREWKQMIKEGKLGKIFYAEGEYIHNIEDLLVDKKTGKPYWRHERPPIWYCAHVIGPLLMLMDDRIVRATGCHTGFNRFPDRKSEPGFLDMEVGLFQTEKGSVIKILRSQVAVRPHMVYYCLYGTKGSVENGRFGDGGLLYLKDEMGEEKNAQKKEYSVFDPNAPEAAKLGGHGTSEYYMIKDFLDSVENNTRPPIDVIRAADFTVPGIIAHKSAIMGGKWLDVPQFNW